MNYLSALSQACKLVKLFYNDASNIIKQGNGGDTDANTLQNYAITNSRKQIMYCMIISYWFPVLPSGRPRFELHTIIVYSLTSGVTYSHRSIS